MSLPSRRESPGSPYGRALRPRSPGPLSFRSGQPPLADDPHPAPAEEALISWSDPGQRIPGGVCLIVGIAASQRSPAADPSASIPCQKPPANASSPSDPQPRRRPCEVRRPPLLRSVTERAARVPEQPFHQRDARCGVPRPCASRRRDRCRLSCRSPRLPGRPHRTRSAKAAASPRQPPSPSRRLLLGIAVQDGTSDFIMHWASPSH